jgi:hypothetical protein
MGMYVSQLRSVPIGVYTYYTYLIDTTYDGTHSSAVDYFFNAFAKRSGVDAVIVRGPDDLTWQLYQFLQLHASADFERLEKLFHEATCLLVSEGALQTTDRPVYVLPLMLPAASNPEQLKFSDALLGSLLQAMKQHQLSEFVHQLGAEEIELSNIKGGMVIATLRWLNNVLELKPNVAGLGVNLNAAVNDALGLPQRSLPT